MTSNELKVAWQHRINNNDILKIKHKNMRTVYFYPMSYEESVFHKLSGYWICEQTGDPIVNETIKIKQEDLQNWNIVES